MPDNNETTLLAAWRDWKNRWRKRLEPCQLTEQFYRTLLSELMRIDKRKWENHPRIPALLKELAGDADGRWADGTGRAWHRLYELEQHLVDLYDPETLDVQLKHRLAEVELNLRPELVEKFDFEKNYKELHGAAVKKGADQEGILAQKRALLARMLNDLQWCYINREENREYSRLVRRRTLRVFMFCLGAFLAVLGMLYQCPWFKGLEFDIQVLAVVSTAGLWGAAFSMMIALRKRLAESTIDDLKVMYRYPYLLSRPLIGLGGALILFFFLKAELVSGNMFPDMTRLHSRAAEGAPAEIADFRDGLVELDGLVKQAMREGGRLDRIKDKAEALVRSAESAATAALQTKEDLLERLRSIATSAQKDLKQRPDQARLDDWIEKLQKMSAGFDGKHLGLLVVWCFIAGFSEKFVPNLIARQIKGSEKPGKKR